jgi:hypothetical protein
VLLPLYKKTLYPPSEKKAGHSENCFFHSPLTRPIKLLDDGVKKRKMDKGIKREEPKSQWLRQICVATSSGQNQLFGAFVLPSQHTSELEQVKNSIQTNHP